MEKYLNYAKVLLLSHLITMIKRTANKKYIGNITYYIDV